MEGKENPYAGLERIFHEPVRTAIMSSLLGAPDGMTFNDLRVIVGTTDGNLSRHLKALEDFGAIHIRKTFVGNRPRTTVQLSRHGRARFLAYLQALEGVLKEAAERIASVDKTNSEQASLGDGLPETAG